MNFQDNHAKTLEKSNESQIIFPSLKIQLTHKNDCTALINFDYDGTVIIQTPPELAGKTFKNLFEATFHIRGKISDPFTSWKQCEGTCTPWEFIKSITAKYPRLKSFLNTTNSYDADIPSTQTYDMDLDSPIEDVVFDDKKPPDSLPDLKEKKLIDPRNLKNEEINSDVIREWIIYTSGEKCFEKKLALKEISHFRRYGDGRCYEFLCRWLIKNNTTTKMRNLYTWQKYTDLNCNPHYSSYLSEQGWKIDIERDLNWSEEDDSNNDDDNSDNEDFKDSNCYQQSKAGAEADKKFFGTYMSKKRAKTLDDYAEGNEGKKRKRSGDDDGDEDDIEDEFEGGKSEEDDDIEMKTLYSKYVKSNDPVHSKKKPRVTKLKQKVKSENIKQATTNLRDALLYHSSCIPVPYYRALGIRPSVVNRIKRLK